MSKQEIPKYGTRYLQTAVIVDEQADMNRLNEDKPHPGLKDPTVRGATKRKDNDELTDIDQVPPYDKSPLDADAIVESFFENGIICGVIGPDKYQLTTLKKADIVVLDWYLEDKNEQITLDILKDLIGGEQDRNAFRLVAIFTGAFEEIQDIERTVSKLLKEAGLDPIKDERKPEFSYSHGKMVIYAKEGVKRDKSVSNYDRIISEENLPKKLINDFTKMTEGLLPGIALTSLAAVRENTHKVLDRFNCKLDPAYLTQRTLISNHEESEQQMVELVAEELRGLMVDAVFNEKPAGSEKVSSWFNDTGKTEFSFKGNRSPITLNTAETINIVNQGLTVNKEKFSSDWRHKKAHLYLTEGFSGKDTQNLLDKELAWIIAFRFLEELQLPILRQGTVIKDSKNNKYLLCIRPRCDCTRLEEDTKFYFLRLDCSENAKGDKIVVRENDEYITLSIKYDQSEWESVCFLPEGGFVQADVKNEGKYFFWGIDGKFYLWLGELKNDFAQRVNQNLSFEIGRVGIEESEWTRRSSVKK